MLRQLSKYPLAQAMANVAGFKDSEKTAQKVLQSRREETAPYWASIVATLTVNTVGLTGAQFANAVRELRVACGLRAIDDPDAKNTAGSIFSQTLKLVKSPLLDSFRAVWVTVYDRIETEGWTEDVAKLYKEHNTTRAGRVVKAGDRAAQYLTDAESMVGEAIARFADAVGQPVSEVSAMFATVAADFLTAPAEEQAEELAE